MILENMFKRMYENICNIIILDKLIHLMIERILSKYSDRIFIICEKQVLSASRNKANNRNSTKEILKFVFFIQDQLCFRLDYNSKLIPWS